MTKFRYNFTKCEMEKVQRRRNRESMENCKRKKDNLEKENLSYFENALYILFFVG